MRHGGAVVSCAVLIAVEVNGEGQCSVRGVSVSVKRVALPGELARDLRAI